MSVYTCQNATLLEITCRGSFSEQSNNYFYIGWRSGTQVTHSMSRFPVVGGCDTWISVSIYWIWTARLKAAILWERGCLGYSIHHKNKRVNELSMKTVL